MRVSAFQFLICTFLSLMLSGCTPTGQFMEALVDLSQRANEQVVVEVPPLPEHPLYVLDVYKTDELIIVDTETWQEVRRTPLLTESSWDFTQDPQGRIWVGYGATPGMETRVQVLAPDGTPLKTLSPCITPYLPIHFAAGRAFIPCLQTGFYAAVAVVDLNSLEIIQLVDIRIPNDDFLLSGTGGDEDYFVLAGGGHGSNRVILLDTHTLITLEPVLIPASNPVTILPYSGRFLMLNSVAELGIRKGWSKPLSEGRPDLLIVSTNLTPSLTIQQMVAPGALWGEINGNTLYAYHDAQQMGLVADPFRAISRLNLITNEAELWPLPDNWNVRDLAIVDGQIILTHNDNQNPEQSGLFQFNPATGERKLLVNLYGAQRLLLGK